MIRPEFRKALESQQRRLLCFWITFITGDFVYLWIAGVLLADAKFPAAYSSAATLRIVLWLVAVFDMGTLVWWKRRFLTDEKLLEKPTLFPTPKALQAHESPLEARAAAVISAYVTNKIVVFALIGAIALYGFVLAFIGRYSADQYLLSLVSGVLLLFEFPSKARVEELLTHVESRG